ncbi:MAG: phosphatase PAP2 family protein [Mangrovibacterium sp.]|nr:phosphatase PAP2 family protein [Mangrovibacterium sp.]
MIALLDTIAEFDRSLFLYLNGGHTPFRDAVMTFFTGTAFWILFYVPLIYFILKKYGVKAIVILVLLALAILVSDQSANLVKDTVQRLRPTHDPGIRHLVHHVVTKGGQYSFFSSHASNTFTVAVFTAFLFRNYRYTLTILSWATLVSYTRIYLGLHYPSDILAGMTVGILLGYGIYKFLMFLEKYFLLLRSPKIIDTHLENKELAYVEIILGTMILTTFLIVNRLQHFNWI